MHFKHASLKEGTIADILVHGLYHNIDDRGLLYEMCRNDWSHYKQIVERGAGSGQIQQVYVVRNHNDCVRAFHKHELLIDLFCIVEGHARFIFIDDRPHSLSFQCYQSMYVTSVSPRLIFVPAGVFHGWAAPKGTILISLATELYKGKNKQDDLDEERIAWDTLGADVWDIQNK